MSRSERLLDLLQALRRRSRAVTAHTLAGEMGVHVRTLYRDIATLQAQGAPVEGEPGVGYVLKPGYTLPPLQFTKDEVEALVLGARWVISRGDGALKRSARNALAKVGAVLTLQLREDLETTTLLVGPGEKHPVDDRTAALVRTAIGTNLKLTIEYGAPGEKPSTRTIWPFTIGFFDTVQIVAAWCELRKDFRHFRLDRILRCTPTNQEYPETHRALLTKWQQSQNIPPDSFELF